MSVSVLLWDFGDTLVDERWMRRAPARSATWERSWGEVMADLADDWNVGAVTSAIVFQALASRTGMSAEDVEGRPRLLSADRVPSLGMAVRTKAVPATSARDGEPGPFHGLRRPSTGPHRSF